MGFKDVAQELGVDNFCIYKEEFGLFVMKRFCVNGVLVEFFLEFFEAIVSY